LIVPVVAGLFTRILRNSQRENLHFEPSNVLSLTMDLMKIGSYQAKEVNRYWSLQNSVQALPVAE
jgi:hypothetical protein